MKKIASTQYLKKVAFKEDCPACAEIEDLTNHHHFREHYSCGNVSTCRCMEKKKDVHHEHGCGWCDKCDPEGGLPRDNK